MPYRNKNTWLRAIVAYYAALDLTQLPHADSGIGLELLRKFSAVGSLGEGALGAPPILVVRAGMDSPWLNAGMDRFVQTALKKGANFGLLNHPEGRHGFDILDEDARSKQIIINTIRFLGDRLIAAP